MNQSATAHHATPAVRPRAPALRRGRGRPTKLTPELQDRLVAAVRKVINTAARCCGIAPSVCHEWLARGVGEAALHARPAGSPAWEG